MNEQSAKPTQEDLLELFRRMPLAEKELIIITQSRIIREQQGRIDSLGRMAAGKAEKKKEKVS